MKPETDQILMLSGLKLVSDFAPQIPTQYGQGMAQVVAALMFMSAQEYDRAADIRASENVDMRAMFKLLAPQIADAELRRDLETAAAAREESLRISALNASNEHLRKVLIRLHAHLDETGGDAKPVWDVLKAMAARRTLTLPG
jgi:hypothetical protein